MPQSTSLAEHAEAVRHVPLREHHEHPDPLAGIDAARAHLHAVMLDPTVDSLAMRGAWAALCAARDALRTAAERWPA
jgi:hypothetical protein